MMKKFLTISLFCVTLFASVQTVPNSFSLHERESLLKELKGSFSSLHNSKKYDLKKGWNKLTTPKEGVDVSKTFSDTSAVQFVAAYDEASKVWAILSSEKIADDKGILLLKYLEPKITFFVLAKSDTSVQIKSIELNKSCKKMMQNDSYNYIVSSVFDNKAISSKDNSINIKTRYLTHFEKGIYNETRVMLIYPKIDLKANATYKYGPANPRVTIKYSKEYEEKEFYIFNYKMQKCYKGLFPSMKIPPYPVLEEI